MKPPRTVFVVGAGASAEFGLPVGSDLQKLIADKTGGADQRFLDQLAHSISPGGIAYSRRQEIARKAALFSKGAKLARSIDNFIHNHREDEEMVQIGKLAIAKIILDSEAKSSLAYDPTGSMFRVLRRAETVLAPESSWLGVLIKYVSAGRSFHEFCDALREFSFISFKYDRCIERFVLTAAELLYPSKD